MTTSMPASLGQCVRDGTFPESDDILNADLNPETVSSFLASITELKNELRGEIRDASKDEAGNVDEWIAQAKKVQGDIARCKNEAKQIVEEHERVERLRNTARDASGKVQLLETEITFTTALENELKNIAEIGQVLNEVDADLNLNRPVTAVGKVVSVRTAIENISGGQTQSLLFKLYTELHNKSQLELGQLLDTKWAVVQDKSKLVLTVHSSTSGEETGTDGTENISIETILQAMQDLDSLSSAATIILNKIEVFIRSLVSTKASLYPSSSIIQEGALSVESRNEKKDVRVLLGILKTMLQFFHHVLPNLVRDEVASQFLPRLSTNLISSWLDPALPNDVLDLEHIEPLRVAVSSIVNLLNEYSWPEGDTLAKWIEEIPKGWLAKRRVTSLEAVRKAFSLARGVMRSVERVERQPVVNQEIKASDQDKDDWDTNWDEDVPSSEEPKSNDDADASGWDFETESNHSDSGKEAVAIQKSGEEDDANDAWGWGDDEETKEVESTSRQKVQRPNGTTAAASNSEEIVLTETYHVTDIPDYILEIIGKDMADAQELKASTSKYFNTFSPANGLEQLPNLTLALFRATAPTYYTLPSAQYRLSNINLYNDTLYISQKLQEHPNAPTLQPCIQSLNKFARQVYTSELEIQRTILADLLDGAQGFERCTTFPNSQACADAVSSTTDRLRQLHQEWSSVLGESHLLQSLGSLVTMIFGKIIKDIEDMDDISEAESKQLVTYNQQILTLEDLFVPSSSLSPSHQQQPPDSTSSTSSSQILLYVPNYLRFQYLQQILEASLVDIKYLWTEGELSLEFSRDEVVDLIKALFAESQHRRNAVRAIRGSAV